MNNYCKLVYLHVITKESEVGLVKYMKNTYVRCPFGIIYLATFFFRKMHLNKRRLYT